MKPEDQDRLKQALQVYNSAPPEKRAQAVRQELERQRKAKANPKQAIN